MQILKRPPTLLLLAIAGQLLTCSMKYGAEAQNSSIAMQTKSDQILSTNSPTNGVVKIVEKNENKIVTSSLASSMLRSYIRVNSMRAYHLDLHSYRADKVHSGDAAHVSSLSVEDQLRCYRHLSHYHQLLASVASLDPMDESATMEALRLADMYGRPPSGLLEGNQFWLGSQESCSDHKLDIVDGLGQNSVETVKSQYCLALAQYPSWNPRDTKTSIKVGMCLPETCTNYILNNRDQLGGWPTTTGDSKPIDLVEQMIKFQFGLGAHFQKLRVRSVYCLPHETSEIRQFTLSAKLLIALLGLLSALTVYATIYDYLNEKLEREKNELVARRQILAPAKRSTRIIIIESFSLIRNFEKFMRIPQSDEQNEDEQQQQANEFKFNRQVLSSSITGLKCVGLIWIIAAHTFLVSPIPASNLFNMDKITNTILANIYLTAHLMVDTFFALSGLLASYLLFKSGMNKMQNSTWIVLTIHRYWRLTSVYLISYWFTKSIGHLLNTGPLWDYGTAEQSPRYRCQEESWLEALLHLSDFKSPKEHCVPFAWFIANGIKFWVITPFILTAIHRSMRQGYNLIGVLLVANMALVAKLAFSSNVDMKSVIEFKPESADNMLNNMDQVYTRPYSRIGAYLVGLLAGHLFYRIDTKQLEVKLSKTMQILLWSLFAVTTIVMIFVLKLANGLPLDDSLIPYIFSISSALIRPLWAVCSCWLVFALSHGQARWLAKFLSANIWKLLVKLSFCAYLAQGEVIAHLYLTQSHSNAFTYMDLITRPIVATFLTMLVSLVMLLVIEYPLYGIEEILLPIKKLSQQKQATGDRIDNEKTDDTQNNKVNDKLNGTILKPVEQANEQEAYLCEQRKLKES